MLPWEKTKFKLEELLEKLLILQNEDKEIETIGNVILLNIIVCKNIGLIPKKEEAEIAWKTVELEFQELLSDLNEFFKYKKIT